MASEATVRASDGGLRQAIEREYRTVADVVAALEEIERCCLPIRDQRGIFATAYLQITLAVEAAIADRRFHDPEWVERYLVGFANLYRKALLSWEDGESGTVPKAWRKAFEAAKGRVGLVLQHLLLGINAHINHDLALALDEVGMDPQRPTRYDDHVRVNEILEEATPRLKSQVSSLYAPVLYRIDRWLGRLDDDFASFSIPKAREHAWSMAVALAGSRSTAERALLLRALDDQASVLADLILATPTRSPVFLAFVSLLEAIDRLLRGPKDQRRLQAAEE